MFKIRPVLAVFVDALKPESLEHMDFLSTMNIARIKTELGAYSPVCETSIFTGVYPKKHLVWFTWRFSNDSSPFRILYKLGLVYFPQNIYSKYIFYNISLKYAKAVNPSIFGFTVFAEMPMRYWIYFDTDIKKHWGDPNLYNGYPNLFEILKRNNISFEIVGATKKDLPLSSNSVKAHSPTNKKSVLLYFIGDIDHLSHKFGSESPETIEKLKLIDNIVEQKYKIFKKIFGDFYFVVFSDHGHSEVRESINIKKIFKNVGEKIENYIHFVDSNYARFWFRSREERRKVEKVFSSIEDKGFVLNEDLLKKYNVNMPDNRYGDFIFYLDKPYIFFGKEISAFGREVRAYRSTHGYLPDYPDSDAVLVSNFELKKRSAILQDLTPSILKALDLNIPDYMDGEPIWKEV